MEMKVVIRPDEIVITGVATHTKTHTILYNLREYIEAKGRRLIVGFSGGPGPEGEGICVRIAIKGERLSKTDIDAIKKFFELHGATVTIDSSFSLG